MAPIPTPRAVARGGSSRCCGGGCHRDLLPVVVVVIGVGGSGSGGSCRGLMYQSRDILTRLVYVYLHKHVTTQ